MPFELALSLLTRPPYLALCCNKAIAWPVRSFPCLVGFSCSLAWLVSLFSCLVGFSCSLAWLVSLFSCLVGFSCSLAWFVSLFSCLVSELAVGAPKDACQAEVAELQLPLR